MENAECEIAFLFLLNLLVLIFAVIFLEHSEPIAVLEAEPELSKVCAAVLVYLSTVALWQTVDEPALVNVSISGIFTILELQDSTETMEVLRVDENLTLVDVVVVFSNAN